ncbi:hypothetical protein E2C01_011441 [Portunus trituberculatus]|uniref:Uncharacterized protein n=1 Tax=Portunus trituberculatus TaxID=210409 RepID=A0A5B7DB33_PORTR|nr:hypothetical protein [Portunus trituberculatus]
MAAVGDVTRQTSATARATTGQRSVPIDVMRTLPVYCVPLWDRCAEDTGKLDTLLKTVPASARVVNEHIPATCLGRDVGETFRDVHVSPQLTLCLGGREGKAVGPVGASWLAIR